MTTNNPLHPSIEAAALSPLQQKVLYVAACLGEQFTAEQVALVANVSVDEARKHLAALAPQIQLTTHLAQYGFASPAIHQAAKTALLEQEQSRTLDLLCDQASGLKALDNRLRSLDYQLEFQSNVLVQLTRLPDICNGNLAHAWEIITSTLARVLNVQRVGIWEYQAANRVLLSICLYDRTSDGYLSGEVMYEADYPHYFRSMRRETVMVSNDAYQSPHTIDFVAEYLPRHQVSAMLDLPLYLGDQFWGVVSFAQTHTTRQWQPHEILFALSMGAVLMQSYQSFLIRAKESKINKINKRLLSYIRRLKRKQNLVELQKSEIELRSLKALKNQERLLINLRRLKQKQAIIEQQKSEIAAQNDELIAQSHFLNEQNQHLAQAQQIIYAQNEQLRDYAENLEAEVHQRVLDLQSANDELMRQNTQLEQFTYITAHNLRAPVARILGLTDILQVLGIEDAEQCDIISRLQTAARDLDMVIKDLNDILEVRRGQRQALEQVPLDARFANVRQMLAEAIDLYEAEILIDFSRAAHVMGVPVYVESILYNLLSNSLKYHMPGRTPRISVSTEQRNNYICLTFQDNGLGMDLKKYHHKVFGLYQRFHHHIEGKGLGLFLIKTQIEAMQGKIELTSTPGEGTTFRIFFPAVV